MAEERVRVTTRLDDDDLEVLDRHCKKLNISRSDYLLMALHFRFAYETHDVDISDSMLYRIDQLLESQANISSRMANLEHVVIDSFRSLLELTRGDNYLLDAVAPAAGVESGEGRV